MKLLLVAFLLLLVAVGTYFLFFPDSVRSYASRVVEMGPTSKSQWLRNFVQSDRYVVNVRAVGIIACIMAAIAALGLYWGR